jgi:hypothetical protein
MLKPPCYQLHILDTALNEMSFIGLVKRIGKQVCL